MKASCPKVARGPHPNHNVYGFGFIPLPGGGGGHGGWGYFGKLPPGHRIIQKELGDHVLSTNRLGTGCVG